MEWYIIALLAAAGILLVLFAALTLSTALVINKVVFGSRQDKVEGYRYFTAEDFALNAEPISVYYGGVDLSANVYSVKPVEECERVVIFQHGFGAGVSSYTTEIARLAKGGFAVVAADAYGCNNSVGENIKGFYAGAEAVIAAYIAVKRDQRLKDKKVVLVGHSWGAYAVLAASQKISVDGVVAISGFNAPAQCLCDQLKNLSGSKLGKLYAPLLHGWFYLINFFKFGAKGNTKAAKALKKSGAKALLIHGEKDKTVPLNHSAAAKAVGDGVTKSILPEKRHNPYATEQAENRLAELMDSDLEGEEEAAYLASFDWKAATEEDEKVMGEIVSFIAGV